MKMTSKMLLILVAMLFPVLAEANWNDPTVVPSTNNVKLGTAFEVAYYNAPANARIVIYSQKGSITTPDAQAEVAQGKGTVSMTIPASAGTHGYYAALCTGTGDATVKVSDNVLLVASEDAGEFKMTLDKDAYTRNGNITVTLENAPACSGDQVVIYPADYTLVDASNSSFTAPTATASVKAANGQVILKTSTSGYYKVYYLLEGKYTTLYDAKPIMVGTPATLSVTKSKYNQEEEISVVYTGLSRKFNDWIGVFPFAASIQTTDPIYRVDMKGYKNGTVKIPAGTLDEGSYKIYSFYNDGKTASVATLTRFSVTAATNTLQYSDAATETYYNIINAADNKCMTTEDVATSTAATKNMKLVTFGDQNNYAQWRIVKRADGKVDIINRATGDYLLSTSTLTGNYNYTKMGKNTDTNNGFTLTSLGSGQFTLCSVEEDGITRYLANITAGGDPVLLDLSANSVFAWKLVAVETVVTAIEGTKQQGESVKVEDGKIVVAGNQNYNVYNAEGVQLDKTMTLVPGIYLLKWADGRSAKICVK